MEDNLNFSPENHFQIVVVVGVAVSDCKQQHGVENNEDNRLIIHNPENETFLNGRCIFYHRL